MQEILDTVAPMPASVLNERFDLLAWNAPYAVLWPGVVGAAPGERNVLWQCFTYPECCHPYVNRHEQVAMLVAQLRGAYGRHVGEPAWTGFVRRLAAVSPEFARAVGRARGGQPGDLPQDLPPPGVPAAGADHDQPGRAGRARHPDGRVPPADEVTRDAIARLLAGEGTGARFPCWEAHQRHKAGLAS